MKPLKHGIPDDTWSVGELRAVIGRHRDRTGALSFPVHERDAWSTAKIGRALPASRWTKDQLVDFVTEHRSVFASAPIPAPAAPKPASMPATSPVHTPRAPRTDPAYLHRDIDRCLDALVEDCLEKNLPFPAVLLAGETGTGKTLALQKLAERHGLPVLTLSFSRDTVLRSLFARTVLEHGCTVERPQELALAIQTPHVVILDEANMMPGGELGKLHELLSNRQIYVPELDSTLRLHDRCLIGATCNPKTSAYSGTSAFNGALLDRIFSIFDVEFFSQDQLQKLADCEPPTAKFLYELRKALLKELSPAVYGIRTCKAFQEHVRLFGPETAVKMLEARIRLMDANISKVVDAHSGHYFTDIAPAEEPAEEPKEESC